MVSLDQIGPDGSLVHLVREGWRLSAISIARHFNRSMVAALAMYFSRNSPRISQGSLHRVTLADQAMTRCRPS